MRGLSTQWHSLPRLTVDDVGGLQAGRTVSQYARRAGDAVVGCVLGRLRGPALLREGGAVQEHGPTGSPLRQSAPRQRQYPAASSFTSISSRFRLLSASMASRRSLKRASRWASTAAGLGRVVRVRGCLVNISMARSR